MPTTDELTSALNHDALIERFEIARQEAELAHTSLAVIDLDIDYFESVNRQYGRVAGDEVLRAVSGALLTNFRDIGEVGRYGGDQFVVLLPGARSETAFVLAEEVRKVIEDNPIQIQIADQRIALSIHVSGGVAEYPADGANWADLYRKADEALYRAKQQNRNRICLPISSQMVTKTSHFTQVQLEKLSALAKKAGKSEAALLREGLDDLLRKYDVA
jgi:diguanylate cyclase (GGDEF)-like protein